VPKVEIWNSGSGRNFDDAMGLASVHDHSFRINHRGGARQF
jgi:hypothetical protein